MAGGVRFLLDNGLVPTYLWTSHFARFHSKGFPSVDVRDAQDMRIVVGIADHSALLRGVARVANSASIFAARGSSVPMRLGGG